jgi:hypothetical protein
VKSENFFAVRRDKSGNLAKLKQARKGESADRQNALGRRIVFFAVLQVFVRNKSTFVPIYITL